jgi:Dolichyl-phosphate-mannose-protein mannosyltransferase
MSADRRALRDHVHSWRRHLEQHALAFSLTLIAIATVRVALTYPVFSHIIDEPAHIACGMEWLDKKTYSFEHQHPPLARVMTALGPYLAGERSRGEGAINREGIAIIYGRDDYDRVLALARMGILPFLWISALTVYAWSRRYFGAAVSVMAVFLFTQLPAILAHTGLATTDMALTALVGATAYRTLVWLEEPTVGRTLVAGVCLGLGTLAKFSAVVFVPAALVAMFVWYLLTERPSFNRVRAVVRPRLALVPLGLVVAAFVIWAGYRFSFGEVQFATWRLPAPELYSGIQQVIEHNRTGHMSYLLGQRSTSGWWYFFPVVLAVKTPLPFLFLTFGGIVVAVLGKTPARWPLAYCAGLLLCAMASRINIGSRHTLPIYIGFSILAASFVVDCLRRWHSNRALAGAVAASLGWLTASVGLSHPDYLAYFNATAGREPERIVVDSDLDWGQDVKRLGKRLQEVGAREVAAMPRWLRDLRDPPYPEPVLEKLGLPPVRDFDPRQPSPGWTAVPLTLLKLGRMGLQNEQTQPMLWPEVIKPTERVGKSILLYYVPPVMSGGLHPAAHEIRSR